MNQQIENAISRIADQARGRYDELMRNARQMTEHAAGRVTRGKKPLKTISRMGLKITAVSHRTADKVLKQNTKLVEHQIDAVAGRLKAVADASNLRELVGTQIRLIPENASQIVSDTREAFSIVAGAGGEIRDIVVGTAAELRGKAPATRKPARKKAASPASKKASKKAAKKVTTRRTPAATKAAAPVAAAGSQ